MELTITINENTPIGALTLGQLFAALDERFPKLGLGTGKTPASPADETQTEHYDSRDYAFGLQGIQDMFNCSEGTAQKYKNTWLAPAVIQRGRKFMVNRKMAFELFEQRNNNQ